MHVKLPLVVGSSSGIYFSVSYRRLKRWGIPQLQRVGRLYIIVSVYQNGGKGSIDGFLTVYDRVPRRRANLYVIGTGFFQLIGNKICCFYDVFFVFGIGTYGWEA